MIGFHIAGGSVQRTATGWSRLVRIVRVVPCRGRKGCRQGLDQGGGRHYTEPARSAVAA